MLNDYEVELAKRHLLGFTEVNTPNFQATWFHRSYYQTLQKFVTGDIKNLMVFIPPQHGKSLGSTRCMPSYLVGRQPDEKVAIVSYSATKAKKFSREIQRIIDTPEYRQIFPGTTLQGPNAAFKAGEYSRTTDEIEIVGHQGSIKTIGVGGPLTGEPVDTLILDDIYKDAKSAWSPTIRGNIQDWYNTVAETRLHNDSRVLIVFTRWHQDDLAGYLLRQEGNAEDGGKWHIVTYPALKIGPPNEYDPRGEGEALWPEKHSATKIRGIQLRDKRIFESLYQQDPKPMEGLLYKKLRTYAQAPQGYPIRAVIDTADLGTDWLCVIIYMATPTGYYILDVYYTQEGMEVTEEEAARRVNMHQAASVRVESNNGGRSFARNVEAHLRRFGNRYTEINWFHQSENKQVRIFTNAAEVQNMIFFPERWDILWPEFYRDVTGYLAAGKNEHDDGPDALTMILEAEKIGDYNIYSV